VREAVKGAGIDPRTWVTAARVEDVYWDDQLGWLTLVRAYGSELEGVELECRAASSLAGIDAGEYLPIPKGAEVLLSLPAASTEDYEPLIVSGLTNEEDKAPTEINGMPIDGDLKTSTDARVAPADTEIKVSPYARREQYTGQHFDQAKRHVLKADDTENGVLLGSENAAKSFVRGEELIDRLIQIVDGLLQVLPTGAVPGPIPVTFTGLPAFQLQWEAPVVGLKAQLQQAGVVLSKKVKGE
jgi:hypothetical protein